MVSMTQKFIVFVTAKTKVLTFGGKMWLLSLDGYTIWQFYKYNISESCAYVLKYIFKKI